VNRSPSAYCWGLIRVPGTLYRPPVTQVDSSFALAPESLCVLPTTARRERELRPDRQVWARFDLSLWGLFDVSCLPV